MRNTILGAVAGLLVGSVGALGYSHYFGDGSLLADLQAQLDAARADLAKALASKKELASETTSLTDQVNQLQASNDQLKKQSDSAAAAAPTPAAPSTDMSGVASILRDMFRAGPGGFRTPQQRMLLLQARLKLSPEQADKISAAMQADDRTRRDMMRQMFQNGGQADPKTAMSANAYDTTMKSILNPEQQRQYAQLQSDETAARANTMANSQLNSVAPLLQLSDSEKDQMFNALYQVQATAPDPGSLMGNPNAAAALKAQADATAAAFQKVLTPDQLALYQQNLSMGFNPRNRGGNNAGNGGGNNGGGNAGSAASGTMATVTPLVVNPGGTITTGTPASGYVANPAALTNIPGAIVTPGTPSDSSSSTNAPTTNAPATNAPATNAPSTQ